MVDQIDLSRVWDDLTNKEFRIATIEETLSQYYSEGDATRARTAGDLDEGESSVETKVAELEKLVRGLAGEPRAPNRNAGRKPISEFKVIQNIAPGLKISPSSGSGIRKSLMPWDRWTRRTSQPSETL